MDSLLQDVRYALRTLVRSPGFTIVALLTLALGVGANAAMFSLVNGILLRPLPYPESERLVRVHQRAPERDVAESPVSPPDFDDWREGAGAFSGLAAYLPTTRTLTGRGEPIELRSTYVTEDFFPVLGTPLQLGRAIAPEEHREGARVVVISDGLWRSSFGADPRVVGSTIVLSGEPFTVVGVARPDFRFPLSETQLWLPQSLITEDDAPAIRVNRYLEVVGRLREGATVEQAQGELSAIAGRLAAEHPDSNEGWTAASVVPLRTALVGDVNRALLVVLAVVGFVLLIGCANLANLMLARAAGRAREIAIRTAMGARRSRIIRQLSTEAVVIALMGGAAGILFSIWGVEAILRLSAGTLPRVEDVGVDLRVLAFGLFVSLLTALLFGLLPALRVARSAPQETLRGGRGTIGGGSPRLRGALVVAEVALAVVLVIGAGLMARSFLSLRATDPGFDPQRVLVVTMSLALPPELGGPELFMHIVQRKEELVERLTALPGVTSVGTIHRLPLSGTGESMEFTRPGAGNGADGRVQADTRFVNSTYFQAMGIPLLQGEVFEDRPEREVVPVVISDATARRLWPGEDAVGKMMITPWGAEVQVAGVVGDVRQMELGQEPQPALYMSQYNAPRTATTLVVRTAGDPLPLARSVRSAIHQVDPSQPIRSIETLGTVLSESVARDRFFTLLFGIFGGLALALAAVGIYGVLAYSVGQRTQEIGVRMALGAQSRDVLRLVIGSGMALVGAGVVLGTVGALLLTRVLEGQLHGVSRTDPLTFAGVAVLLALVALIASYLPARRAVRLEPTTALRNE